MNKISPSLLAADFARLDPELKRITDGGAAVSEVNVINMPGAPLPETGGFGTTMFYVLGAILVIGGSAVLIARKRREEN